jgi:hypothetical protein
MAGPGAPDPDRYRSVSRLTPPGAGTGTSRRTVTFRVRAGGSRSIAANARLAAVTPGI